MRTVRQLFRWHEIEMDSIIIIAIILATAVFNITTSRRHDKKLQEVHVLVNSNMTAAMQAELDATIQQLVLMREVVDLKQAMGSPPSEDSMLAIDVTEQKISELRTKLDEHKK